MQEPTSPCDELKNSNGQDQTSKVSSDEKKMIESLRKTFKAMKLKRQSRHQEKEDDVVKMAPFERFNQVIA